METIINTMPTTAKTWVYQANRAFSTDELTKIEALLTNFIENWNSHGQAIYGAFEIKFNQFIVLMADENKASVSGCSIDSSVAVIREIERQIGIDLLDKSKVAFLQENNTIELINFTEIKKAIQEAKVTAESKTFNNMLTTFGEYSQGWIIEAQNSWLKRYF